MEQIHNIRNKIYNNIKPKKMGGKCLNVPMLISLCKGYLETINKGMLPNVESAWFYVCRNEGLKAIQQATSEI